MAASRAILQHSKTDAILIALSMVHAVLLVSVPSIPIVALGVRWNSNTVAHNFVHLPFFRSRRMNMLYSTFLTLLLGIPQTLWRDRHLAHHRGDQIPLRITGKIALESTAV